MSKLYQAATSNPSYVQLSQERGKITLHKLCYVGVGPRTPKKMLGQGELVSFIFLKSSLELLLQQLHLGTVIGLPALEVQSTFQSGH